jgi:hypothetical protein
MKEREGGLFVIFAIMAVVTIGYAYAAGFVQLPKHLFEKSRQETAFIPAAPAPIRAQPVKRQAQACAGEIKGGFCVVK